MVYVLEKNPPLGEGNYILTWQHVQLAAVYPSFGQGKNVNQVSELKKENSRFWKIQNIKGCSLASAFFVIVIFINCSCTLNKTFDLG